MREGAQDYLEKRRVNAGMLSRIVSYSVERNNFHRDLVRATRRYQDLFNNVPVALFTANQDGALKTANAACMKLLSCQGIPLDKVNFLDLLFEPGKRAHFLDLIVAPAHGRRLGNVDPGLQGQQAARADQHRAAVRRRRRHSPAGKAASPTSRCSSRRSKSATASRTTCARRRSSKPSASSPPASRTRSTRRRSTWATTCASSRNRSANSTRCSRQLVDVGGEPASKLLGEADFDYLKEEIPRALNQSLEGVDRVAKIVRAMKEFSHPAREKTATDLNRAIQSTITVASNEWKYVAEIEMDLDTNLPAVHCSPAEFNQVVLNMIVNAAHAISDVVGDGGKGKGKIRVQARGPTVTWRSSRSPTRVPACRRTSSSASSIRSSPPRKSARARARAWPSPTT